ncbi:MAG: DUF3592 domain-containing protein [Pseudomonadota bacterium]
MTGPNSGQDAAVHPALKKALWWCRRGWLLALPFIAGLAAAGEATGQLPLRFGLPFGLFILSLAVYIGRTTAGDIRRSIRVMKTYPRRSMILTPLGTGDHTGSYVRLGPAAPASREGPTVAASLKVDKSKPLPPTSTPAAVYFEAHSPDRFLVVEAEGRIYWGRLADRDARTRAWKRFRLIFLGLTGLLFLALTVMGLEQLKAWRSALGEVETAAASLGWPRVSGQITSSEVVTVPLKNKRFPTSGFELRVRYEYAVDGRSFEGRAIRFGDQPARDEGRIREQASALPPGRTVEVSFNPLDPSQSVLKPGGVEEIGRQAELEKIGLIVIPCFGAAALLALVLLWLYLAGKRARAFRPDA